LNKPVLIILNGLQTLTKPVVGGDAPAGESPSGARRVRRRMDEEEAGVSDRDLLLEGERQPEDNVEAVAQARARGA